MATELVIKISGDLKNYEAALQEAEKKTAGLESALGKIATISGVAFATLTGEIFLAAKAFGESQASSNSLTQALQNQGMYSVQLADAYKKQAAELQKLTGFDDDNIIKMQASLQGMIGQKQISFELTKAILDLSAAKGMDLQSTAELVAKGINGHVGALEKLGIHIDANLTKEEKTAQIIDVVSQKYKDQAAATNQGLGSVRGLTSAFGDFQEEIGKRVAPVLEGLIKGATRMFETFSNNEGLMETTAQVLIAGTTFAGLTLGLGVAGLAFLKLRAIMIATAATTGGLKAAVMGLVGATGIGLISLAVSELVMNWSTAFPKLQAVFSSFTANMWTLAGGLGQILHGALNFDLTELRAGWDRVKSASLQGYQDISKAMAAQPKIAAPGVQDPKQSNLADEAADREIAAESRKTKILQAERELNLMNIKGASSEAIALKTQEVDTLKKLDDDKNIKIRGALETHLAEIEAAQVASDESSAAQGQEYQSQVLEQNAAFQSLSAEQQATFLATSSDKLRQSLETKQSMALTYANKKVAEDIQRRNQFLADEREFGTAYAVVNSLMHSKIAEGSKQAFNEMVRMQNSQNAILKGIGKAAAVANIIINTAESAMNAYKGFSTIPIIGIPLGIAAAAAAIAFGAEQVGNVMAAAQGGIVTGGIRGMDSVPAMLMPGELVVPTKNYEEVVGAVAQNRGEGGGMNGSAHIMISLKDDLIEFIEAKLIERTRLNISLSGAA